MSDDSICTLIDDAFRTVLVVGCSTCEGLGSVGFGIGLTCPDCKGSGRTTERIPIMGEEIDPRD